MKPLLAAIQFLTVIPIPWAFDGATRQRSIWCFPLVGLFLGAMLAGLDTMLLSVFPANVASVLNVTAALALTGALHADGLADSADALFSRRPRERMLEIMRDSRSGPLGVCALVILLLIKCVTLAAMVGQDRRDVLLLMPIAGRCAIVATMGLFEYARTEGLASAYHATVVQAWSAILCLLITSWAIAGLRGVLCAGLALAACLLLALYCTRKIGGYTGDTLGAACELVEMAILLCWTAEHLSLPHA